MKVAALDYRPGTADRPQRRRIARHTILIILAAMGAIVSVAAVVVWVSLMIGDGERRILNEREAQAALARVLGPLATSVHSPAASIDKSDSLPPCFYYRFRVNGGPKEVEAFVASVAAAWDVHENCAARREGFSEADHADLHALVAFRDGVPPWWPRDMQGLQILELEDKSRWPVGSQHVENTPFWMFVSSSDDAVYLFERYGWNNRESIWPARGLPTTFPATRGAMLP